VSTVGGDGILIGGSKGLGPTRYGPGEPADCSQNKGYHCDPFEIQVIFYDPEEIADVLRGQGKPWHLHPYAVWRPSDLWRDTCGSLGGIAFDPKGQQLYVVERLAGPNGKSIVHAYRVRDPSPPILPVPIPSEVQGSIPLGVLDPPEQQETLASRN